MNKRQSDLNKKKHDHQMQTDTGAYHKLYTYKGAIHLRIHI